MIFGIIAFILLILSLCIKDRKKSLSVQSLNCFFEALYAFYINAFTGAVLGIINFIRSFIFIRKDKINKKIYFLILIFFESIIIGNCIYTWNGIISILPTIGSVIRTYCLWQENMTLVRSSGIVTGIFFGLYYCYYQSWIIVVGYIILLIISIINIYKKDVKNRKDKQNERFIKN